MNNVRDILPKISNIAGATTNNIKLANKLVEELDPQTFREFVTFLGQAEGKIQLIKNRHKRYGF